MQDIDLFVIGGGINGAGIARDAAGRGLRVALVEQDDFGGATSSASSKLIHGGLRYLEHFEFRLVAESLAERELLLQKAAHLIKPLQFVLPHVPNLRPAWMIRAGLWLYDHLGGGGSLPRSQSVRLHADELRADDYGAGLKPHLLKGFAYWDAWTDDARLVIANLHSARAYSARLMSRTRFIDARAEQGKWQIRIRHANGEEEICRSRMLVNAAGPWVAQVLHGVRAAARAPIRLVKGSHIVVPRVHQREHAYILQNADKRVLFILPYERDFSLIGTTDVVVNTPEEGRSISTEETRYLLAAANVFLAKPLSEGDIRWSYSGVRPLYDDGNKSASAVTRDYTLKLDVQDKAALLNVYGGKVTTYRKLAEAALHKLEPWVKSSRGPWTGGEILPGSDFEQGAETAWKKLQAQYSQLTVPVLHAIFARHGSESAKVLQNVETLQDLGAYFGANLYEREVRYMMSNEWALQAEDVLWRRSKAGLHMSEAERTAFAAWFRAALEKQ